MTTPEITRRAAGEDKARHSDGYNRPTPQKQRPRKTDNCWERTQLQILPQLRQVHSQSCRSQYHRIHDQCRHRRRCCTWSTNYRRRHSRYSYSNRPHPGLYNHRIMVRTCRMSRRHKCSRSNLHHHIHTRRCCSHNHSRHRTCKRLIPCNLGSPNNLRWGSAWGCPLLARSRPKHSGPGNRNRHCRTRCTNHRRTDCSSCKCI